MISMDAEDPIHTMIKKIGESRSGSLWLWSSGRNMVVAVTP